AAGGESAALFEPEQSRRHPVSPLFATTPPWRGICVPEENIMQQLGTLEELPLAYRDGLSERALVPLWPLMRDALPHDKPTRMCTPHVWKWSEVRPNLLKAGELTPIEKAERRVLILANPGLGLDKLRATPSIFI